MVFSSKGTTSRSMRAPSPESLITYANPSTRIPCCCQVGSKGYISEHMFAWDCVDWVGHMAISCDECLCVFTEIVLVIQILKDIHHLFKKFWWFRIQTDHWDWLVDKNPKGGRFEHAKGVLFVWAGPLIPRALFPLLAWWHHMCMVYWKSALCSKNHQYQLI